jgi:hypothetical protein
VSVILNETRKDYAITTREGVLVKITGVPTRTRPGFDGEPLDSYSMGVALRIEELTRRAVQLNPTPGATVELEFA